MLVKAGRQELLTALAAGIAVVAFAAASHWLVAVNRTDAWLEWLYLSQHLGVNFFFALLFGRTLAGGREPLVTGMARLIHPRLTPLLLRYTRRVTQAWALFFLAMAAISALLFALAPIGVWSAFANLLTLPLVAAMFIAENEVRKRVLPPEDCIGILAAVRAFRAAMKS